MEFLKDIAIPQSLEHFRLVVLIAAISSLVFIPYTGFVLGSSVLSLWYNRKGHEQHRPLFVQFAHALVNVALYSKSVVAFLALIPGLSIVFSYAQMLQETPAIAVSLAGFGFLFLLAACTLLYSYKYTFRVEEILESYQGMLKERRERSTNKKEVESYRESNFSAHLRTGRWGLFCLIVSVFLYSSAMSVVSNPSNWSTIGSAFDLLIAGTVWLKFIQVLIISTGVTGIGILFFSFALDPEKLHNDEYILMVKKLGIRLSVFSLLTLPLLVLSNVASTADTALSGEMYTLVGIGFLLFFLTGHFLYGYVKSSRSQALTYGFVTFLSATAMLSASDHVLIETATRNQAALLAYNHKKSMEELSTRLGITTVTFTGEDIYNARCSSCHLFDQKKVGPPYFETVPKYKGNKADLVTFILNPTLKDPGYPPMPNPGLRPAEADSIAAYLIRTIAAHTTKKDSSAGASLK